MSKRILHILMLEDNELDAELNQEQLNLLEEYDCSVKVIQDKEAYISEITSGSLPDLILCDYTLPMFNGMEALHELNSRKLLIPFIFVTGTLQEEVAADAIKEGAWDYVVKDRLFRLPLAVKGVLALKKERDIALKAEKRTQKIVRGIDETSMLVIVIDKDYKIDYVNQNFTKVSGFPFSEVSGKSIFSVFSLADQELLDNIHAIFQKREAFTGDFKIRKNGSHFWERLSVTPIFDDNNALNSYNIIADDITDQKKLEKDLRKSLKKLKTLNKKLELAKNKAEESDNLKTAFLANLSHEIRTPMNGILGFADLIKQENLAPDMISQYIDIIEESGKRMLNLINDLVDISKIEANQIVVNPEKTNLNKLMDELYDFFFAQVSRKGITFVCEKGLDDSESYILIDKLKLEQVLSNLLNNALKFTKKGTILFQYKKADNRLVFSVKDTGKGIVPGLEKVIFERFRQAEISYLKEAEGLGLGLSISKSFVEKMGGEIWVDSEYGSGAEFFVSLPFVSERSKNKKKIVDRKEIFDKELTILIAEDDEINYLYFENILSTNKIKLYHAENGKQAVDLYKKHSEIDLILMDLKMPLMNGIDATTEIRKGNQKVPIIALTAYVSDKDKQTALMAGCNDFLTKPVKKEVLWEKISAVFDNNI
ncbi:hybrid sensor histidine kinase/response regulator [Maribellus maritimus]|uniref:hybrid sensor histidine kinase/response regulator n=1 Tax=Maribellus maritimus TaxID=2870838 RepID=UPI001EECCC33|nr:response regulator [Maribellus maritimus]MCG6186395.1 response regulator [Maribellus maritimus]